MDKVQNEFLSALRSGQKLNCIIVVEEQLIKIAGKTLLVFHIPEMPRQSKPVYLNKDISRSFIRRGASDERCTDTEINRMLRDAMDEPYEKGTVDLDTGKCFDEESLSWYRKLFDDRNPNHNAAMLPHLEFLNHWGLVVEIDGQLSPTRAAILLFGTAPAFHRILPRPVVDWQWRRGNWSEELSDERWADRLVVETNLMETWKTLSDRFLQRAEKPFSIDPETLQRQDLPPDYAAFREAAINMLIHQDYSDLARKPTIQSFDDCMILWNPGDAFASKDELLKPGGKEVRNPQIVAAFRHIGLSEQAGTGIRTLFESWLSLGYVPPLIDSDKARKTFKLTLLKEKILSEEQFLFQKSLGVHWDEVEARTFALICREGQVHLRDVRIATGLSNSDALEILKRLVLQGLVSPLKGIEVPVFSLAEHLKRHFGQPDHDRVGQRSLFTAQTSFKPKSLSATQIEQLAQLSKVRGKIFEICDVPRSLTEIMNTIGTTSRGYFKKRYLRPLLQADVLRMTYPDRPNHPNQAYELTEAGASLRVSLINRNSGGGNKKQTNDAKTD